MKLAILFFIVSTMTFAGMSKKEKKVCVKVFKKYENKRSDKNKKVLTDKKCLEEEEFSLELARIEAKSPAGDYYDSKYNYKKNMVNEKFYSHMNDIKTDGQSFEKLRMMEPKRTWFRLSSCSFKITDVSKMTGQVKDKWKINVQISDALIHVLSNVSFKDKVLMNEDFEDDHFARIMDKINEKAGAVMRHCVLRDVF